MSRLSRANLHARESIFASGPEQYLGDTQARCPPDLEECVMAMEDCCEELYEAQVLLRNGTQDLPRMTRVLQNERVFLLVNEETVKRFKTNLADEIEPAISELIERAEQGLVTLEKKQQLLETKVTNSNLRSRPATSTRAVQNLEAKRLQTLTKQREKLEAEVQALEQEVLELKPKMKRLEATTSSLPAPSKQRGIAMKLTHANNNIHDSDGSPNHQQRPLFFARSPPRDSTKPRTGSSPLQPSERIEAF